MGTKDPEAMGTDDAQPRERKHRSKTDKGDKDERRPHKSSSTRSKHKSSSKSSSANDETSSSSHRRHRTREEKERDRERKTSSMSDLNTIPELARTESRVSLPYPTFSKAHSKENFGVHHGDSTVDSATGSTRGRKKDDPLTPEPTDLTSSSKRRAKSADHHKGSGRPPSPPETDVSGEKKRNKKTSSSRLRSEEERPRSRTSGLSRSSSKRDDKSRLSTKSRTSSQATYIKDPPTRDPPPPPGIQIIGDEGSNLTDDRTAGARSVGPKRKSSRKSSRVPSPADTEDSPVSIQDSSPRTPTGAAPQFPPHVYPEDRPSSSLRMKYEPPDRPTPSATPATDFGPPPPPPPPPPPLNINEVPRVDYLLQYGGLANPVAKNFLGALPRHDGSRTSNPMLAGPETLFAPFFNILDQYQSVLHKQGSIAVATGHKSVARRLLDRLEDVFSRDLPAEGCHCIMCERTPEAHRGLGWGEVLERVGGRVEMPSWPPFDLGALSANAIENTAELPPRPRSPVKMDPDIAEEFREHYLRQSKKVRSAVDKWMNNLADDPTPAPSEIDDETLSFAVSTNLDQEERPYFNALISGARELQPAMRAPTPMRKPRTDFMVKTGLALQRLYRLPQAPRDAETAVFLVRNPFHHDLLATITDITPQEWEILISGRFDGFLWSGADGDDALTPTADGPQSRSATPADGFFSPPPSRGSMRSGMGMRSQTPGFSRNTTPFSGVYSRGGTPASFISLSSTAGGSPNHNRGPVSHDEEVEVAALAEVERDIYQGMEALEDAFEKLHLRAEMVRNALRQRNAGLSMSLQSRRAGRIDVLPQLSGNSSNYERPAWAASDDDGAVSESEWGGDDIDLFPEDSASNISSSRHRRPKRRTERRTPAPIEEDDEEN